MLFEKVPDKPISNVEDDGVATPDELREEIDEIVEAEEVLYDIRTLSEMLLNEELTVKEYMQRSEQLEGIWPEQNKILD